MANLNQHEGNTHYNYPETFPPINSVKTKRVHAHGHGVGTVSRRGWRWSVRGGSPPEAGQGRCPHRTHAPTRDGAHSSKHRAAEALHDCSLGTGHFPHAPQQGADYRATGLMVKLLTTQHFCQMVQKKLERGDRANREKCYTWEFGVRRTDAPVLTPRSCEYVTRRGGRSGGTRN